jgi:hypothetical protein
VRCDTAQEAISAAMDERAPVDPDTERHLDTCPRCTRFATGAWRIREAARFELAPPVPDVVPAIMARIREQEADRLLGWGPRPSPVVAWVRQWRAPIATAAAGLILGIVLTSGGLVPIRSTQNTAALASEIPRQLVQAAAGLRGYQATFDITESNWTKAVPRRTFVAEVSYLAPESFRVQVRDTSRYPSDAWPRNDLVLVTDGRTWEASGPDPCPSSSLPACPTAGPVHRSIVDRPPFDPRTAMPTDVIVPMTVLAASDRVSIVGPDNVSGHDAIAVRLTYQDASSLFQYLHFLGSWRPFFPQDRVDVWLDHETWFPLRYDVRPAAGPERTAWATQMGLPTEPANRPVFVATVRRVSTTDLPSAEQFIARPGPEAVDEGFQDLALPQATRCNASQKPVQPCETGSLRLYRYGRFLRSPLRPYWASVLAYADGLAWMTVTQVQGWKQDAPFGIGPFPEAVKLGSGRGVGYYEPASATDPRRLALHTAKGEFLLATNLPRTYLIAAAASLPLPGLAQPDAWRIHRWSGGVVEEGVARALFPLLVPGYLPPGYTRVAAQTARSRHTTGVTLVYRRPAAELDGVGLILYQAEGQILPPPDSPDEQAVAVGTATGRWSPEQHLLEWVDGGIYRSLSGPVFDLSTLVRVAVSLRPEAPS